MPARKLHKANVLRNVWGWQCATSARVRREGRQDTLVQARHLDGYRFGDVPFGVQEAQEGLDAARVRVNGRVLQAAPSRFGQLRAHVASLDPIRPDDAARL